MQTFIESIDNSCWVSNTLDLRWGPTF